MTTESHSDFAEQYHNFLQEAEDTLKNAGYDVKQYDLKGRSADLLYVKGRSNNLGESVGDETQTIQYQHENTAAGLLGESIEDTYYELLDHLENEDNPLIATIPFKEGAPKNETAEAERYGNSVRLDYRANGPSYFELNSNNLPNEYVENSAAYSQYADDILDTLTEGLESTGYPVKREGNKVQIVSTESNPVRVPVPQPIPADD